MEEMLIKAKVFPKSAKAGVIQKSPDTLMIRTKAKAEAGQANAEVLDLVAKHLAVPVSFLRIIKGLRSRNKIIEVRDK
jgi:hypothetical protein